MSSSGRNLLALIESFTKFFSFTSKPATQSSPAQQQQAGLVASKLEMLLNKVGRAQGVLEKLQLLESREAALRARYEPLLTKLQLSREQVQPAVLEKAASFALNEGLRVSLLRATGRAPPAEASWQDPFGILVALSSRHGQAPMTWRSYMTQLRSLANHTEQVLGDPSLEEAVTFNNQRRHLAAEMAALQRTLGGEVELPSLGPLQRDVAALDAFVQSVMFAKRAHEEMLRRDVGRLDLTALELRFKLALGDKWSSSEASQILQRLHPVQRQIQGGGLPSVGELEEFEKDLRRLGEAMQAQQRQGRSAVPEVQEQRYQKLVFDSISQAKRSSS